MGSNGVPPDSTLADRDANSLMPSSAGSSCETAFLFMQADSSNFTKLHCWQEGVIFPPTTADQLALTDFHELNAEVINFKVRTLQIEKLPLISLRCKECSNPLSNAMSFLWIKTFRQAEDQQALKPNPLIAIGSLNF